MQEANVDPATGVRLLGGEMSNWIDTPTQLGVVGQFLRSTLRNSTGSILLIGRTAIELVKDFPEATTIVRGLRDATRLHSAGHTVMCGGLDRLPAATLADTVLLLDGPGEVLTPDSPGMSHAELLRATATHVAPGGRLIARVPGGLRLSRMLAPEPRRLVGDQAWWVGTQRYDDRSPILPELPWPPTYFIVNSADTPTAIATVDMTGDGAGRTALRAALSTQPACLDALDAGVLVDLADGWLLIDGPPLPTDLPPIWTDTLISDDALAGIATLTPTGVVGSSFEADLLTALRSDKQIRLRWMLTSYAEWVPTLPQNRWALAVPRHTIRSSDGLTLVNPAWSLPIAAPTAQVAVAHGLLDLAHTISLIEDTGQLAPELNTEGLANELGSFVGLPDSVWIDAQLLRTQVALPKRGVPITASIRPEEIRITELNAALRDWKAQVNHLQHTISQQTRYVRSLEHTIATEHGSRARRVLFLMTAPRQRIVEAARSWLRRW